MLIDLHAHSSGISKCCKIPYDKVLTQAISGGIDGIVLTNHYQKSYIKDISIDEFIKNYISEFYAAEQYGKQKGCKVLFGIEVTMELYKNVHMLIYGVSPDFLRKNPFLFDCTQKELYELVKANNGVLIQAHPFRNGSTVLDTDFLDGVEINCHPKYSKSYAEELLKIAQKNHLILTCGGDYHADTYRPKCGMFIPNKVKDNNDLRAFLLSDAEKELLIQEPNSDVCFTIHTKI